MQRCLKAAVADCREEMFRWLRALTESLLDENMSMVFVLQTTVDMLFGVSLVEMLLAHVELENTTGRSEVLPILTSSAFGKYEKASSSKRLSASTTQRVITVDMAYTVSQCVTAKPTEEQFAATSSHLDFEHVTA